MKKRIIFYSALYVALWVLTHIAGTKDLEVMLTNDIRQSSRLLRDSGIDYFVELDKPYDASNGASMPSYSYYYKAYSPLPFLLVDQCAANVTSPFGRRAAWLWVFGRLRPIKVYSAWQNPPPTRMKRVIPTDFEWVTDLEVAEQLASDQYKLLILYFHRSKYCRWSKKFDEEILSQQAFKDYAGINCISVSLDVLEDEDQDPAVIALNKKIARKYDVENVPAICILRPGGKVLKIIGYQAGGVEPFLKEIKPVISPIRNDLIKTYL